MNTAKKKISEKRARYDTIALYVRKGIRDQLKKYAEQNTDAKSLNSYILRVLQEQTGIKLELDNDLPGTVDARAQFHREYDMSFGEAVNAMVGGAIVKGDAFEQNIFMAIKNGAFVELNMDDRAIYNAKMNEGLAKQRYRKVN